MYGELSGLYLGGRLSRAPLHPDVRLLPDGGFHFLPFSISEGIFLGQFCLFLFFYPTLIPYRRQVTEVGGDEEIVYVQTVQQKLVDG